MLPVELLKKIEDHVDENRDLYLSIEEKDYLIDLIEQDMVGEVVVI